MANATVFSTAITRDSALYENIKEYLGDRFIDVVDFPDGVPVAWQDKQLCFTGKDEPWCDCFMAIFGIKDCTQSDLMDLIIHFSGANLNPNNVHPPYMWADDKQPKEKTTA